ncbi:EF-hand domain-containing protein [Marivita geojedonensis]|uniref:EF-hand domain-containing protein n=1 Tax=Marivita geojedonensis TaxID=1123756 RepID=A0A1X4NFA3_9RHOB|nr:EF-hand domain-containing protein [Marivita geojedonensis]OSQ45641.1 hypothetical protein MGEO_18175 [Marivita geojedonensis]PRY73980.1 Ca2+-binding EF-hand superfamily protein [Marivita geojedonensis]
MSMNKQVSTLVIAALLATGATTTFAHENGARDERRTEMFAELDTNGDGSVSAEEFANRATPFARADADGDGFLTAEEIAAMGQERSAQRAERMIARFDTNEDGKISEEEMTSRRDPARMFERLDANDDGVVSADEFADARMGKQGGKRGGHSGSKRHGDR